MRAPDDVLAPWYEHLVAEVGPLDVVDVHTHIGANDPDGFKQTPQELLDRLGAAHAHGVVFPMHEPEGYAPANDTVLAVAGNAGGRLTALCRVDPANGGVEEARRCLEAGAAGIKLHPRAEGFTLSHPAVRELVALAHERRAPVLVHAGRGIPALGRDTLHLAQEFPDAALILAHAAISDLAWMWRELPSHPNVFIDSSWWNPGDLLALFALAPPGQVLYASDSPYGTPVVNALLTLRCALQAGVTAEQARWVMGAQAARLLAGRPPEDLGPAPGPDAGASRANRDPLLARAADFMLAALNRRVIDGDGDEPVALARLAAAVPEDEPQAEVCAHVLELIDRSEALREDAARPRFSDLHVLSVALAVARTPDVVLPADV